MKVESICFAWEEGAICKGVCDHFYPVSIVEKEEILRICRNLKIDGITTIASDVAVLTVNYVAEKMGLVGNPNKYSQITTNKYQMRQCFMENDVPSSKYALVDEKNYYQITGFKFPLIVKPTDRSGSRGVEKVLDTVQLEDAVLRAQMESFEHKAIIEEFVTGREISVESISYKGEHFILQITDKITTGAPFFVELEHHQPSSLPEDIKKKVREIVKHALNALHIQYGASHSELKITESGDIRVIEIGARMGGDFIGSNLVQLSTGYDFLKGVVDVAFGDFKKPIIKESNYSGVFFLSEETKYLKPVIENWRSIPEVVEAGITDSELRKVENSGDRSGFLIYHTNTIESHNLLIKRIKSSKIRFQGNDTIQ